MWLTYFMQWDNTLENALNELQDNAMNKDSFGMSMAIFVNYIHDPRYEPERLVIITMSTVSRLFPPKWLARILFRVFLLKKKYKGKMQWCSKNALIEELLLRPSEKYFKGL
jgi:hypothetical protein